MPAPNITGGQITGALGYGYWTGGAGLTLNYSVPGAGALWPAYGGSNEPTNPAYHVLNGTQATAFAAAMELYDSLLGATFNPVSDSTPGAIRIAFSNLNNVNTWGYAYLTEPNTPASDTGLAGDIWLNTQSVAADATFAQGSYDWHALMHEIGHALGLKHTFDPPTTLPAEFDNYRYSIMSYTPQADQWNWVVTATPGGVTANASGVYALTPMLFDIYTLQSIYGADPNTRSGNTTYNFDPSVAALQTIYDAGGTDTWDLSGHARPSYIDLTPAAFSSIDYFSQQAQVDANVATFGEGYRSFFNDVYDDPDVFHWQNNVAIAYNTIIENVTLGENNDSVIGNDANNVLLGNGGNDTLSGGNGNDTLNGGAGIDNLNGGAGDDTFVVDNASDVVTEAASQGTDTVQSSITWTLGANVENLVLTGVVGTTGSGNTLNNTVTGNESNNVLYGRAGDDALNGAGGTDTLWGGDGNDTLNGGAAADFLDGGNNDDVVNGGDANDTIYARAGNDTLDGAAGADTMYGGAGDDVYVVDNASDLTIENSASGADTVQSAITFSLNAFIENLTLTGADAINGIGNILANTMTGNDAANTLSGVAGTDTLYGMGGDDVLNGGNGNDTLYGGANNDILDGGNNDDTLWGGDGNDTLYGRTQNDTLNGEAGNDTLYGGDGDDVMNGGDNTDLLDGGNHNDTLSGGNGDDTLYGRQNNDVLNGDAGADTLYGGDGTDTLNGGAGADILSGGNGDDAFVFNAGEAAGDSIVDFHGNGGAAGDTIVFHGYGLTSGGATFIQLDATHWQINSADGTHHDTITVTGVVDPSDYLFV